MHNQPRGFVDHQEIVILMQNLERNFLRLMLQGRGSQLFHRHFVAGAELFSRFGFAVIEAD